MMIIMIIVIIILILTKKIIKNKIYTYMPCVERSIYLVLAMIIDLYLQ